MIVLNGDTVAVLVCHVSDRKELCLSCIDLASFTSNLPFKMLLTLLTEHECEVNVNDQTCVKWPKTVRDKKT